MNATDKKPDYKAIYEIVSKRFHKAGHFMHGPFDETFFTMRVYETAKDIIKKLKKKCKKQQILTACLLHDIGKIKLKMHKVVSGHGIIDGFSDEWQRHATLSVPIAGRILKKIGHSKEFIEEVCYLIKNHDNRKIKISEKSIELKILQDADLIADCGMAGFIRGFTNGGKFKKPIIGTVNYMQKHRNRVQKPGKLNLKVAKDIAKEKMKLQIMLTKRIAKDINSDVL